MNDQYPIEKWCLEKGIVEIEDKTYHVDEIPGALSAYLAGGEEHSHLVVRIGNKIYSEKGTDYLHRVANRLRKNIVKNYLEIQEILQTCKDNNLERLLDALNEVITVED